MPENNDLQKKKNSRKSRIIWIIIFILVNGGVIAYTAVKEFSGEKPELGYKFPAFGVFLIIVGFLCMFLALAVETVKYIVMMRDLGVKVSWKVAFETAALGKYYDNITPSGVGGQPFQIYNMYKSGYNTGVSAAMPLASFLFMQLAFIFLAILTFIFRGGAVYTLAIRIPAFVGIVFYSIVPFFIILFSISDKTAVRIVSFFIRLGGKIRLVKNVDETLNNIIHKLQEYQESLKLIASKKKLILKLFLLSLLYQVAICSIPFFLLHAYNGRGSYIDIFAQTIFIYCAITIIPTPGNSGAAEGSFYLIFSQLDYSGLFWSMLIWRFIVYYSFIIIGILVYARRAIQNYLERKKKQT